MKAMKATAGIKLAGKFCKFPDGRVVYGPVWGTELGKAIDRLIARERRKERNDCYLLVCGVLNKFRNEALRGQHKRDVAFVCDDMIEAAWKALYPECIKSAKKGAQR